MQFAGIYSNTMKHCITARADWWSWNKTSIIPYCLTGKENCKAIMGIKFHLKMGILLKLHCLCIVQVAAMWRMVCQLEWAGRTRESDSCCSRLSRSLLLWLGGLLSHTQGIQCQVTDNTTLRTWGISSAIPQFFK